METNDEMLPPEMLEKMTKRVVQEPDIVINDQQLSAAQAMAVRVAVSSFPANLVMNGGLGDDEHGKAMVKLYTMRCNEIMEFISPEKK